MKYLIMKYATVILVSILLGIACITLSACTTAGPYVTNISSDGQGNLIIQKGYAEYNWFFGVLGNKEASQSIIKIGEIK